MNEGMSECVNEQKNEWHQGQDREHYGGKVPIPPSTAPIRMSAVLDSFI